MGAPDAEIIVVDRDFAIAVGGKSGARLIEPVAPDDIVGGIDNAILTVVAGVSRSGGTESIIELAAYGVNAVSAALPTNRISRPACGRKYRSR